MWYICDEHCILTAWAVYTLVEYVIKLQKRSSNIIPGDFPYESGPLVLEKSGTSTLYKRADDVQFENVVANMNGVPASIVYQLIY